MNYPPDYPPLIQSLIKYTCGGNRQICVINMVSLRATKESILLIFMNWLLNLLINHWLYQHDGFIEIYEENCVTG